MTVTGLLTKHAITLLNVGYSLGFCSGCLLILLLNINFELSAFQLALVWLFTSAIDSLLILGLFGFILQLGRIWFSVSEKYGVLYGDRLDEVRGTTEYSSLLARVDTEANYERNNRLRSEFQSKIKWPVVVISGSFNLLVFGYTVSLFAATLPPGTRIPAPYGAFLYTAGLCGLLLVPLLILLFRSIRAPT